MTVEAHRKPPKETPGFIHGEELGSPAERVGDRAPEVAACLLAALILDVVLDHVQRGASGRRHKMAIGP